MKIRRFLKTVAIVLIFLPEPFTTPFGIALLAAVMATGRQKSLLKFKNKEELIKRSLNKTDNSKSEWLAPPERSVVFHCLKTEQSLPPDGAAESSRQVFQGNAWFDNRRVSEKIWHHTLNNSVSQYEARPAVMNSSAAVPISLEAARKIEPPPVKTDWTPGTVTLEEALAGRGWSESYPPDKVVHHTLQTGNLN
jgi:hypothetical protein